MMQKRKWLIKGVLFVTSLLMTFISYGQNEKGSATAEYSKPGKALSEGFCHLFGEVVDKNDDSYVVTGWIADSKRKYICAVKGKFELKEADLVNGSLFFMSFTHEEIEIPIKILDEKRKIKLLIETSKRIEELEEK
jgi:hypothetical protein